MPARACFLLIVALAAVAAGCGTPPSSAEDFTGQEREVAEVVEDIQRAGERNEADRICGDFLTERLEDGLGERGSDCTAELEKAIEDADSFELEVQDVTVQGTTATARVRGEAGGRDTVQTYRLVKGTKDGQPTRWRVDDFGSA